MTPFVYSCPIRGRIVYNRSMQGSGTNLAGQSGPLVGRRNELAVLEQLLERTAAGRLQVALVTGEPGIGKTRLLDAIQAHASRLGRPGSTIGTSGRSGSEVLASGWLVLRGGASEAEGMPPYLAFLLALGPYLRAAPAELLSGQLATLGPISGDHLSRARGATGLRAELPAAARTGTAAPMGSNRRAAGRDGRPATGAAGT